MKSAVFVISLLLVVSVAMAQELSVEEEWANFKSKNGKSYDTDEEEAKRLAIFTENLNKIRDHNKKYETGEVTYKQGINAFADLTSKEFKSTHLGALRPSNVGSGAS